ncbi:hypothetical protein C8R45DRAFT_1031644 [Mycena sanguinolenta]|nr:hypothetical protein C8R45DRAFT_1031644 [Mycena sanguinolenta]
MKALQLVLSVLCIRGRPQPLVQNFFKSSTLVHTVAVEKGLGEREDYWRTCLSPHRNSLWDPGPDPRHHRICRRGPPGPLCLQKCCNGCSWIH